MNIFGAIWGFIRGPGAEIARALQQAYSDKQNATTEQERIAADERIRLLEVQAGLIAGKQGNWFVVLPQWVMGMSLAIYVAKVFVWDYALGLGVTGELKGNTWAIASIVLGGYFLTRLAGR